MCRMLGVAMGDKIALPCFEEFRKLAVNGRYLPELGERHEDGWGVGGYLGNWTVHFGRSARGAEKERGDFLVSCEKARTAGSPIVIAHLRKASAGELNVENAHPFIDREWMFCHNGTVYNPDRLRVSGRPCAGTTDSEILFKFLVSRLEGRRARDYRETLKEAVAEIKRRCGYTSLTFLLSDGRHLVGYRDFSQDEGYYTLLYSYAHNGFIFCSEPLPGHEWIGMRNGEMIIVDKHGGFLDEN